MKRFASFFGTTLALVAAIGIGGVVAAPAASAAPSCGRVSVDSKRASVTCQGSGQFRLVYSCKRVTNPYLGTYTFDYKYSSWVKAPLSTWVSSACNTQYGAWVETK